MILENASQESITNIVDIIGSYGYDFCGWRPRPMIIETECAYKLTINDSDNGLSPDRRLAIIWTNAGVLFIRTLETNLKDILSEIQTFSFKIMNLKMPSAKWRKIYIGLNALLHTILWWRHQMETCSALLAFCAGNSLVAPIMKSL